MNATTAPETVLSAKERYIADHLEGAIRSAQIIPNPAPYIYFENALPNDVYDEVIDAYRATRVAFQEQIHKGDPKIFFGSYADRLEVKIPEGLDGIHQKATETWMTLRTALFSRQIFNALRDVFRNGFDNRFGTEADYDALFHQFRPTLLATKHEAGYYLGPHTDRWQKIITCILNFPEQAGLDHIGTALYEPLKEGFVCDGKIHHNPALFRHIGIAAFRPNSSMIFFRDSRLFHGVETITPEDAVITERRNVQFNIWQS